MRLLPAKPRELLSAYFAAQLLLAIIGAAFIAGFWSATALAIAMLRAAS